MLKNICIISFVLIACFQVKIYAQSELDAMYCVTPQIIRLRIQLSGQATVEEKRVVRNSNGTLSIVSVPNGMRSLTFRRVPQYLQFLDFYDNQNRFVTRGTLLFNPQRQPGAIIFYGRRYDISNNNDVTLEKFNMQVRLNNERWDLRLNDKTNILKQRKAIFNSSMKVALAKLGELKVSIQKLKNDPNNSDLKKQTKALRDELYSKINDTKRDLLDVKESRNSLYPDGVLVNSTLQPRVILFRNEHTRLKTSLDSSWAEVNPTATNVSSMESQITAIETQATESLRNLNLDR